MAPAGPAVSVPAAGGEPVVRGPVPDVVERAARPSFISVGEGAETGSCWCCFYARHRRAAAIFSGQEEIEKAGRPPTARVWQGEEVFEQYVRDMLIYINNSTI